MAWGSWTQRTNEAYCACSLTCHPSHNVCLLCVLLRALGCFRRCAMLGGLSATDHVHNDGRVGLGPLDAGSLKWFVVTRSQSASQARCLYSWLHAFQDWGTRTCSASVSLIRWHACSNHGCNACCCNICGPAAITQQCELRGEPPTSSDQPSYSAAGPPSLPPPLHVARLCWPAYEMPAASRVRTTGFSSRSTVALSRSSKYGWLIASLACRVARAHRRREMNAMKPWLFACALSLSPPA